MSTPPSDLQGAFGRAVRRLRLERSLSQEKLAEEAGLHRTYVGDIERGRRNISLVNIDRVAGALAVTLPGLMVEVEWERGETGN
jgi:transcriptional regulator with XRE-family HTH domain